MNILLRFVFVAPFALTGAWPASADLAPSAPRPAQLQMAEAKVSTTDRTAYTQKAQAELQVWRVKLDEFGQSVKADSSGTRKATADDLNKAWTKAKDASAKLETAGEADWESTKASFRKASDELAAIWTQIRAEAK
jgi:hypothetical protein